MALVKKNTPSVSSSSAQGGDKRKQRTLAKQQQISEININKNDNTKKTTYSTREIAKVYDVSKSFVHKTIQDDM